MGLIFFNYYPTDKQEENNRMYTTTHAAHTILREQYHTMLS